jgi:N-acetylneuraminate synthase
MCDSISIGGHSVGKGNPTFIIAEVGINHNGDLDIAKRLIDSAVMAGCDAVKFQKRTPELCVPAHQRSSIRATPWGEMTYLEYRHHIEFGKKEYDEIHQYCNSRNILWFASCWDEPSVDFIKQYSPPVYKIAAASLTDDPLLRYTSATGAPIILSTGMSTLQEIHHAVSVLDIGPLLIAHNTSSYPCKPEELNLRMIPALEKEFQCPVGYSGHEVGLQTTLAAVTLGACFVERHVTLDRAMWGSDQAASVEPSGLIRLVRDIRVIEKALGDGIKRVYEGEKAARERLRKR